MLLRLERKTDLELTAGKRKLRFWLFLVSWNGRRATSELASLAEGAARLTLRLDARLRLSVDVDDGHGGKAHMEQQQPTLRLCAWCEVGNTCTHASSDSPHPSPFVVGGGQVQGPAASAGRLEEAQPCQVFWRDAAQPWWRGLLVRLCMFCQKAPCMACGLAGDAEPMGRTISNPGCGAALECYFVSLSHAAFPPQMEQSTRWRTLPRARYATSCDRGCLFATTIAGTTCLAMRAMTRCLVARTPTTRLRAGHVSIALCTSPTTSYRRPQAAGSRALIATGYRFWELSSLNGMRASTR
jgi:hypothetical protein